MLIEIPDDIGGFWEMLWSERGRGGSTSIQVERSEFGLHSLEAFDVTFRGSCDDAVDATFVRPRTSRKVPCIIRFGGYGEGRGHPLQSVHWPSLGFAELAVDTRGQSGGGHRIGTTPSRRHPAAGSVGFVTAGLNESDPADYYYADAYIDAGIAVSAARDLPGVDGDRIVVAGTSQGGTLALAASALNDAVAGAIVRSPFLCAVTDAASFPDRQPYRELRRYLQLVDGNADRVLNKLRYYDGARLARLATCPGLFSLSLADEVCSPSSTVAVFEAFAGPKRLSRWLYENHGEISLRQSLDELDFLREILDLDLPEAPCSTSRTGVSHV